MAWQAAAAGLIFAAFAAQANEYKLGDLTIDHPWARPNAGTNGLGAAYLTIKNAGQEADTLKSASSPDAGMVEVHEHILGEQGVMQMRAVEGGLTIPAGGTVEFKPGGYHFMIIGLKHSLEDGQSFPLKLTFEHAGTADVEVKIEKRPEGDSGMQEHHH